jgi:Fur family transcriptional regulator, zinc uptake regulator
VHGPGCGHDHAHEHDHHEASHGADAAKGRPALGRNQSLVLATLDQAAGPMTAYGVLDALRGEGLRAPLQVYRALEKLMELGLAHRLESINAFVSCRHPGHHDLAVTVFMLCEKCGRADETDDAALTSRLAAMATASAFRARHTTIELRGLCAECAAA